MKAWNVTADQLTQAAEETGVRISGPYPDGKGFRFTLKTSGPTSNGRPVKYGRVSQNRRRKDGTPVRVPGAVCWHGHRDFMRAAFRMAPDMRLKSALADYRGSRDFEQRHGGTHGAGASYYGFQGLTYGQACDCGVA